MTKALLLAALLAAPRHATDDWQSFSPAGAGFTVMLPGHPQQSTIYTPTAKGRLGTLTASVDDSLRNSFLVSWTTYAEPNGDVDRNAKALEQATHALLNSRGGKLVSDETIQTGTMRGRQATFRLDDGRVVQVRFFLAGTRFYQVMSETRDVPTDRARAEKFLNSFEIRS